MNDLVANPSTISAERERQISSWLNIDPDSTLFKMFRLTIGDLNLVSVVSDAILSINLPAHLFEGDVTALLDRLDGLTWTSEDGRINVLRQTIAGEILSVQTSDDTATPPSQASTFPLPKERAQIQIVPTPTPESTSPSDRRQHPALRVNPQEAKYREFCELLVSELDSGGTTGGRGSIQGLFGKIQKFSFKESRHARNDGCAFITFKDRQAAITFINALGFSEVRPAGGKSIWGSASFEKRCHRSETRASAQLSSTAAGEELTIQLGEPLLEELSMPRAFSCLTSNPSNH